MSSDWPLKTLGEVSINHDSKRKAVKEADRRKGEYPYYGASGVVDYVDDYIFEGDYLLVAEDGENLRSRQTPIAFRASGKFWVNNHAHIITGNDDAITHYLEYAIIGTDIQAYLTGAVMPKLTQGNLNKIEISCPDVSTQLGIVAVLGSIDDRITLLRETNQTLEAIAQAIFKSWFVDFDPVRAKMEGRQPVGMDEDTAALFPDELVESELGLIPRGWKIGTLGEIMELHKGPVMPNLKPDEMFEHYSLPAFDNGRSPVIQLGHEIKSNKTSVPSDAILVSKLNPSIPRVWLPSLVGVNAVCSTEFLPLVPRKPFSTDFIYGCVIQPEVRERLSSLASGTSNSHQRITPATLLGLPTCLPAADIANAYHSITESILRRWRLNALETQDLVDLRDTLLPRLISGKLRVPVEETHAVTNEE